MITVVIDGFEVTVPKGTLVIRAAEQLGIQIPRFCDHPLLDPVGACRQCLVDIEINGRSLMDAIEALEQRLNIMVPNPELEKEWDELKELGDRYRELEKQCKEKGQMWTKLRKVNKSGTQG